MTNPVDGRITSLSSFTGVISTSYLMLMVAPAAPTTAVNYKITVGQLGNALGVGTTTLTGDVTGSGIGSIVTTISANVARLDTEDQTLAGGANVTSKTLTTGNVTIDCGARPLQYITNNGAFTITAPTSDGSCLLLITNGASAGVITWSGFGGGVHGDALNTVNGDKFTISIWRINGSSDYLVKAYQ